MRPILLVVVLAGACGKKGSEPKAGDCAATIERTMELSKEDYKKNGIADSTLPKLREAAVKRCTDDKWPADVHKCVAAAKTSDDATNCQGKLSKEQQDNLGKDITAVMNAAQPSGSDSGSGSADQGSGSADSGSAGSGSAAPAAAGLPAECNEYKTMIEKLAACDKVPQASRDALKKAFDTTSQAWAGFDKLPDDSKKAMTEACKGGVTALKQAGSACGL